jgi:hypothetical protein
VLIEIPWRLAYSAEAQCEQELNMKLLSTIRPDSLVGSGNAGGALRLFFTTLNPDDFHSTPPPIMWQGGGKGAVDTYRLPSNDVIALNLNLVSDVPGRLYVFGSIQVTTSGGAGYGPAIGQAASVLFSPEQPVIGLLRGHSSGTSGAVHFDVGFELAVPWDGTSADCHGAWWARWR